MRNAVIEQIALATESNITNALTNKETEDNE